MALHFPRKKEPPGRAFGVFRAVPQQSSASLFNSQLDPELTRAGRLRQSGRFWERGIGARYCRARSLRRVPNGKGCGDKIAVRQNFVTD
jgi:hypothetical protein